MALWLFGYTETDKRNQRFLYFPLSWSDPLLLEDDKGSMAPWIRVFCSVLCVGVYSERERVLFGSWENFPVRAKGICLFFIVSKTHLQHSLYSYAYKTFHHINHQQPTTAMNSTKHEYGHWAVRKLVFCMCFLTSFVQNWTILTCLYRLHGHRLRLPLLFRHLQL